MKKTLIAVPSMDFVPIQFTASLMLMRKPTECIFDTEVGSLIYHARNRLAHSAIKNETDYVLWLDSDMTFNPDAFERLYAHIEAGADMVTGLYFRRVPPFSPVLFDKIEFSESNIISYSEFKEIPDKPFTVGACGFGCVLMKTDVLFDLMAEIKARKARGDLSFGASMFEPKGNTGEDIAFCWRARQCGYEIICDPSIPFGHVGHTVITRQFWEANKD